MARVIIHGLTKRFAGKPSTTAIDNLDLQVEHGEFLVLLGPSGCGKTTTLRAIAGLEIPEEGHIELGNRTVFDASARLNVATHKRNLGMVFQSYALWPHMTVRKNIGYPLRTRRIRREVANASIVDIATIVDCEPLLDRYPAQLSGGQQQRVALCRGLVARPELVLFDEPLSNLDARLRDQVRTEIHELHHRLQFTGVYVTHDQAEAMALGDRLAIMRAGKLEQLATPREVFEQPATEYVAEFIGMANRLLLEWHDGRWTHEGEPVDWCDGRPGEAPRTIAARSFAGDVQLAPPGENARAGALSLRGTVVDAQYGGAHLDIVVRVGHARLQSRVSRGERDDWVRALVPGQAVQASILTNRLILFGADPSRVKARQGSGRPLSPPAGLTPGRIGDSSRASQ